MAGQRPLEPLVEVRLLPRERKYSSLAVKFIEISKEILIEKQSKCKTIANSAREIGLKFEKIFVLLITILGSSNGRTAASEAVSGGSTPPSRTRI